KPRTGMYERAPAFVNAYFEAALRPRRRESVLVPVALAAFRQLALGERPYVLAMGVHRLERAGRLERRVVDAFDPGGPAVVVLSVPRPARPGAEHDRILLRCLDLGEGLTELETEIPALVARRPP